MSSHYIYDRDNVRFRRQRRSVRAVILRLLKYFVASISLAVLYYLVFSIFFSTEKEKELRSENRMYQKLYPDMEEKQRLLEDVVSGLQVSDNVIYNNIFHSDVVSFDDNSNADFLSESDTLAIDEIVGYAAGRLEMLDDKARGIDRDFMEIFRMLSSEDAVMPPLSLPIDGFSYASSGASVGERINPFYKVKVRHDGFDMIAPSGTPVYASADGLVTSVVRSRKGLGNVVEIEHEGGYHTKYAHLADINVLRGRRVKKGTMIGKVGVTGNSFAPHLHYELWRDTVALNPVNYFFSSVSPEEYTGMLLLSASAGQSLD